MSQDRYNALFARTAREGRGAFIPFFMIGDPTPEASLACILTAIESGADALELGLPFSDPIADGPVIQAAALRAFGAGVRRSDVWRVLREVRARAPEIPIGLLTYANLVESPSRERFYADAADAGVDSVLVADVPVAEAPAWVTTAQAAGVAPVLIATPFAPPEVLDAVARLSRGYVYTVTRAGVTGERARLERRLDGLFDALKAREAAPAVAGFGIATPDHVRDALAMGAAGAISGSAVVRIVAGYRDNPEDTLARLGAFVAEMRAATAG